MLFINWISGLYSSGREVKFRQSATSPVWVRSSNATTNNLNANEWQSRLWDYFLHRTNVERGTKRKMQKGTRKEKGRHLVSKTWTLPKTACHVTPSNIYCIKNSPLGSSWGNYRGMYVHIPKCQEKIMASQKKSRWILVTELSIS